MSRFGYLGRLGMAWEVAGRGAKRPGTRGGAGPFGEGLGTLRLAVAGGQVRGGNGVGDVQRGLAVADGVHVEFGAQLIGQRGVGKHVGRIDDAVAGHRDVHAEADDGTDVAAGDSPSTSGGADCEDKAGGDRASAASAIPACAMGPAAASAPAGPTAASAPMGSSVASAPISAAGSLVAAAPASPAAAPSPKVGASQSDRPAFFPTVLVVSVVLSVFVADLLMTLFPISLFTEVSPLFALVTGNPDTVALGILTQPAFIAAGLLGLFSVFYGLMAARSDIRLPLICSVGFFAVAVGFVTFPYHAPGGAPIGIAEAGRCIVVIFALTTLRGPVAASAMVGRSRRRSPSTRRSSRSSGCGRLPRSIACHRERARSWGWCPRAATCPTSSRSWCCRRAR